MKIFLASDLHLEFDGSGEPDIPPEADVIVLAGDIAVGRRAAEYALSLAESHLQKKVILIAGNHEAYHRDYWATIYTTREMFKRQRNAHFLEQESLVIDGVLFCGCTLWSGFDAYPDYSPESAMGAAERGIADYRLISLDRATLTPQDTRGFYEASREWLKGELERSDVVRKVVITHFPPDPEVRNDNIPVDELSAYFQANCRDLMRDYEPDLWLFGHNHYNHDTMIEKTRVVSNQRGYPGEMTTFQPDQLIHLDAGSRQQ
ncbi:MAG: hypothetical protein CMN84_10840 [Spongiibacteraceae bacterium]|jgi:predicted phosphohydrolase|nr:hypothetical protein [Spongiibacteraceae bacterium]